MKLRITSPVLLAICEFVLGDYVDIVMLLVYILLSFRKDDDVIEQAVPYSYSYWFAESEQQANDGDDDVQPSTSNAIVFWQDT